MKLRIDVEIEDHVADYHFNGKKKSAREYISNEVRFSIAILDASMHKHFRTQLDCKVIDNNQGSREA